MEKMNLLLLEDEVMDAYLVRKTLEKAGMRFDLVVAADKHEYIQAIRASIFDGVLADHAIPQFNAVEALQILRENNIDVPFILVTGTVSEEFAVSIMKDGAADYILKDRLQRLPNAVESAVEKYRIGKERERMVREVIAKEAAMQEAERMAHFGSWCTDVVNNTCRWSDEKFRILGYEPNEVKPSFDQLIERVHPDDRAIVRESYGRAMNDADSFVFSCRILCPHSEMKHIESEVAIKRNDAGVITYLNGFIRDVTDSKRAELKILESEQKYRHLFENNPFPQLIMDTATLRFLDVNKAAVTHYGYSPEEFRGMTALDLRHNDERDRFLEVRPDADFNNSDKGVWKHVKKDGSIISVRINVDGLVFEGREANLVIVNDITEQLKAEQRLRESEARLLTSQRIGHIGGWELNVYNPDDINANELRWTEETFQIFGLKPEETDVSSALFFSMVHTDDRAEVIRTISHAINQKQEYSIEHRIIRKDGTLRYVHELGEIIEDKKHGLLKVFGTIQDITARKKADEMLQKSEANLRAIFDNTEIGYALLDTELKIVSYNRPMGKFCTEQMNSTVAEGTYAVDYFAGDKKDGVKRSLQVTLRGASPSYEVGLPQADGYDKWFQASYHPVWNTEKEILGVIMAISDITERKISELQEKKITADLLQRNKDLEQFAYIISHNLRSPVANIIGVCGVLNEGGLTDEEHAEFMEAMNISVKKLDNVIIDLNQILQVKYKVNENKERVNFTEIVHDIKYSISNFIENEFVEIRIDFSEIEGMSTLKSYIHSIFYNLISNSIKYRRLDVRPVIEIKSKRLNDDIELIFTDNCMGIDLEKKGEQVFGLYKRFHPQSAEGKGIGLFMVKTQVETLGGKISLTSEVNKGTEFRILFKKPEYFG